MILDFDNIMDIMEFPHNFKKSEIIIDIDILKITKNAENKSSKCCILHLLVYRGDIGRPILAKKKIKAF